MPAILDRFRRQQSGFLQLLDVCIQALVIRHLALADEIEEFIRIGGRTHRATFQVLSL